MKWSGGQCVTKDGVRKMPELHADSWGSLMVSENISHHTQVMHGPIGFHCRDSCFGRSTLAQGIRNVNCGNENVTIADCDYRPEDNGCDDDAGIICSKCELGRGHMKYCLMTHAQAMASL